MYVEGPPSRSGCEMMTSVPSTIRTTPARRRREESGLRNVNGGPWRVSTVLMVHCGGILTSGQVVYLFAARENGCRLDVPGPRSSLVLVAAVHHPRRAGAFRPLRAVPSGVSVADRRMVVDGVRRPAAACRSAEHHVVPASSAVQPCN